MSEAGCKPRFWLLLAGQNAETKHKGEDVMWTEECGLEVEFKGTEYRARPRTGPHLRKSILQTRGDLWDVPVGNAQTVLARIYGFLRGVAPGRPYQPLSSTA